MTPDQNLHTAEARGAVTPGNAAARELGHHLRQHRSGTAWSQQRLAEYLGWTVDQVHHVERGLVSVAEGDLARWLGVLPCSPADSKHMHDLCRAASPLSPGYSLACLESLAYHESTAVTRTSYHRRTLPASLQEPTSHQPNPRRIYLLHQDVLHAPQTGFAQFLTLALQSDLPHLSIRVVAAQGNECDVEFTVLELVTHPPIVSVQHHKLQFIIDDGDVVAPYLQSLSQLRDKALSQAESLGLFAERLADPSISLATSDI